MEEHLLSVFLQALFLLLTGLLSVDSITLRSRLETIFNHAGALIKFWELAVR